MQIWEAHVSKDNTTWCGAAAGGWLFVDAGHALRTVEQDGTTQPCPNCLRAIAAEPETHETQDPVPRLETTLARPASD